MRSRAGLVVVGVFLAAVRGWAGDVPVAVSPGGATGAVIESRCPTFSWGTVPGAQSYELVVYVLGTESEEAKPVLRQTFAGSVSGWTPSLDRCLAWGGRYAWSVRAVGPGQTSDWSPPSLFAVAPGPSEEEFEQALEVVRQFLATPHRAAAEPAAPTGAPVESAPAPEPAGRESSLGARATPELVVDGGVTATSFAGDGSGLTALSPANLSAGTAAIDISGTAATAADLVCTDCVSSAELDFDSATQAELDLHEAAADAHREHATLEESLEIDADITTHAGNASAHHAAATMADITPTTAKGDLLVEDGADVVRLPAGTDGQVLMANSGATEGVGWSALSTRRLYYLAKSDFNAGEWTGVIAQQACGSGFHMASIWEILDPSNLSYASTRSDAVTADDSGTGPPVDKYGWVRTGNASSSTGDWGVANCSSWTTKADSTYGTQVGLPGSWVHTGDRDGTIEPWEMSVEDCKYGYSVWCIED